MTALFVALILICAGVTALYALPPDSAWVPFAGTLVLSSAIFLVIEAGVAR